MAHLILVWKGAGIYRLRQLGVGGMVGLSMLVATSMLLLFALLPAWQKLDGVEADMVRLSKVPRDQRAAQVDHSPQATLKAFYAFLPAQNAITKLLAQLYTLAEAQELEPQKVEYVLTHSADAPYSRYQITLPVTGRYVAVRKFMANVLNEMPAAAINEVSFKRVGATGQDVEAMIRITIFLSRRH